MKLLKTPPATSDAGKCEELDEAAYTDWDVWETWSVMTGVVFLCLVQLTRNLVH
jgi:hypothetical protein